MVYAQIVRSLTEQKSALDYAAKEDGADVQGGADCFYVCDLPGDVVAIIDANATQVVEYVCDYFARLD